MRNSLIKKKYVFIGDYNSINIELISKSFSKLKGKTQYILIGNVKNLRNYLDRIRSKLYINEILDPYDFKKCSLNSLNIFNIEDISSKKYINLLNQLKISNDLSNNTKIDLVTMPINKSIFKREIKFIGLTEELGRLNNKKTIMMMHGEEFSVIPLTTHINPKYIYKSLQKSVLKKLINNLLKLIDKKEYCLNFKAIHFLCYNPHCGEQGTLGSEDKIISNIVSQTRKISGLFPADSAFSRNKKNSLYISTYHDQALIPFKLINKKGVNFTLGLNYRRLSPTHGTATDIKFKNISNNSSYLACMKI